MTHKDLCTLAVMWLQRPASRKGPGCTIAISETSNWINGEVPDAIGWRPYRHERCGSVVVEVKVTRADFMADRSKAHRRQPELGMGNYRYFLAPEGLISRTELPPGWGLIEVSSRRRLQVRTGHVLLRHNEIDTWRHQVINQTAEISTLAMCLNRVADIQKVQDRIREADNRNARLTAANEQLIKQNTALNNRLFQLRHPDPQSAVSDAHN